MDYRGETEKEKKKGKSTWGSLSCSLFHPIRIRSPEKLSLFFSLEPLREVNLPFITYVGWTYPAISSPYCDV
jgi:hypothetical protein